MKNAYLSILVIMMMSATILSACSSVTPAVNLAGTSWQLVAYGSVNNQVSAAAGVETNLEFGKNGQVGGNFGCNSFSGDYKVRSGKIEFGALMSTEMACPEPQMTQESSAFQVMNGKVRYEMNGDSLTIYGPGEEVLLVLKRR